MLRWKLREIKARYRIKNKELAKKLNMTETAVSNLINADKMPRLTGDRLVEIAIALSELSSEAISPLDLVEYISA